MKIGFLAIAALALLLPSLLTAQVQARPISPAEAEQLAASPSETGPQEIPSPMLLEVKVPPHQFTMPALAKQKVNLWTSRETAAFVSDRATVRSIQLKRTLRRKDQVLIEVIPDVATGWSRQDIDLTVALRPRAQPGSESAMAIDFTPTWSDPGAFAVAPGVHRIPLPLPQDALRAVNVYAVESAEGLTLIDAGWAMPQSMQALEAGLATIGHDLTHETRRFVVQRQRLFEIDDVDSVTFPEDVLSHLGVPETGLMSEMDARFQHLSH